MKIRENYPIRDRLKVFIVLLCILYIVWTLTRIVGGYISKAENTSTMDKLLQTSLEPVGSTMYIWGGGWDDEDSESGSTSTQIGLSPQWKIFAKAQDENYDFKKHRFERENGLDCSGYVGWVIYNTFESESGQAGYVTTSTELAESLANRGWGTLIQNPREFLPGDIVSMEGHVWICLGTCADGSVLLVHSSPPGVSVCGTVAPQDGTEGEKNILHQENGKSIAVQLAEEYMTIYFPNWQEKYPNRIVSSTYLENVSVFRWNERTMLDAKKIQNMSGEEIIVYMSPDI